MTHEAFDPAHHIMVVRDAKTGRHVHVTWSSVLQQMAAAPAAPVDLSPLANRIAALEAREASTPAPAPAPVVDLGPIAARVAMLEARPIPEPTDISGLAAAVDDAAVQLAMLADRLAKLEARHETHEHNYQFTAEQLSTIASAVLEHARRAA
jgi:hypothetical protein